MFWENTICLIYIFRIKYSEDFIFYQEFDYNEILIKVFITLVWKGINKTRIIEIQFYSIEIKTFSIYTYIKIKSLLQFNIIIHIFLLDISLAYRK